MPSRVVTVMGFEDGFFYVRTGTKKTEKITESMMMDFGILVPKHFREEKKSAPKQEYVNLEFKHFFEDRQGLVYQEKVLKGFKIEDEVVEDFAVAIAEE